MLWNRRRDGKTNEESVKALEDAEKNLKAIQERGEEVTKVAKALKEIRERNHFAEMLEEIIFRSQGGSGYDARH